MGAIYLWKTVAAGRRAEAHCLHPLLLAAAWCWTRWASGLIQQVSYGWSLAYIFALFPPFHSLNKLDKMKGEKENSKGATALCLLSQMETAYKYANEYALSNVCINFYFWYDNNQPCKYDKHFLSAMPLPAAVRKRSWKWRRQARKTYTQYSSTLHLPSFLATSRQLFPHNPPGASTSDLNKYQASFSRWQIPTPARCVMPRRLRWLLCFCLARFHLVSYLTLTFGSVFFLITFPITYYLVLLESLDFNCFDRLIFNSISDFIKIVSFK